MLNRLGDRVRRRVGGTVYRNIRSISDQVVRRAGNQLELVLGETHNQHWKNTARGSRLSFVELAFIDPTANIFTMGSCFAREVRRAFENKNFSTYPKYNEIIFDENSQKLAWLPELNHINHYNTFVIRQEFESALNIDEPASQLFIRIDPGARQILPSQQREIWQDPLRKHVYGVSRDAIAGLSEKISACLREGVAQSDIYVITLGLTEIWRDRESGLYLNQTPDRSANGGMERFEFRQSTYEENYRNMCTVCSQIEEHFPDKKIILTVSPVPLKRTYTGQDVVVANMESKSILRSVAGAISREFSNVVYWPSYEIALARDMFEENGRDVTRRGVDAIISQFIEVHVTG